MELSPWITTMVMLLEAPFRVYLNSHILIFILLLWHVSRSLPVYLQMYFRSGSVNMTNTCTMSPDLIVFYCIIWSTQMIRGKHTGTWEQASRVHVQTPHGSDHIWRVSDAQDEVSQNREARHSRVHSLNNPNSDLHSLYPLMVWSRHLKVWTQTPFRTLENPTSIKRL